VRVEVRAVVLVGGRVLVAEERRRGERMLSLPGGRVEDFEKIGDALVREVEEETGLTIVPGALLYVAEVVHGHTVQDLNLVFAAEPAGEVVEDGLRLVELGYDGRPAVMPPIMEQIAADAESDWARAPRWLGNIWQPGGGR
jgi:8-oxo-dGTP pyrophosphatase MutT (NUDIX family)